MPEPKFSDRLRVPAVADPVIIVGGGTSGAALAARLSEDPSRSVLLLEQGPDDSAYDATVLDPIQAGKVWAGTDFAAPFVMRSGDREVAMVRGRVLGGTSAVNYLATLRGQPADYDAWAAMGLDGWGWADILETFRSMETDVDFGTADLGTADLGDGALHGSDGPLTVRRTDPARQAHCHRAFDAGLREIGVSAVADINDPAQLPGVGIFPVTVDEHTGERLSVSRAYLTAEVRARANLRVETGVTVARVLVRDGVAVGVQTADGREIPAAEVIVCCGATESPALLQRSGIGPRAVLEPLGIDVVADLPGVGANLQDHIGVPLVYTHPGPSGLAGGPVQPVWVGRTPDAETVDFHVFALPVGDGSGEPAMFSVVPFLLDNAGRGSVRISGMDPEAPPEVLMPALDSADLDRLTWVLGNLARWEASGPFAELGAQRLMPQGDLAAADSGPAVAGQNGVIGYGHLGGTCAMGADDDPQSVLDAQCRVRGIEALRVVDASSMPVLPAGNTYLGCVMMAERVARMMSPE